MADKIKIDEARAKMWIADVKNEIDIVEGILSRVTTAMLEVPGEDDVIIQGIQKIGKTLTSVWDKMIKRFKDAGDIIKTTIEKTVTAATELGQDADALNKKHGG